MVMTRDWPRSLCPASVSFQPNVSSASGGVSLGGDEQVVISSTGRWRGRIGFNQHFRRDRAKGLAARSMIAFLKGRTNRIFIGPYDHGNSPGALSGGFSTNEFDDISHNDDTLFDDGEGYSEGRTFARFSTTNPRMGDLSAQIHLLPVNLEPRPGQYFSIGKSELHLIDGAEYVGETNVWQVSFWPSLRHDYSNYVEELNFDTPSCEMRLAADDGYGLDIDRLIASAGPIDLVEAR